MIPYIIVDYLVSGMYSYYNVLNSVLFWNFDVFSLGERMGKYIVT